MRNRRNRFLSLVLSVVLLSAVIVPAFAQPMTVVLEATGDTGKEYVFYIRTDVVYISTEQKNVEKIEASWQRHDCGFIIYSVQENASTIWRNHTRQCNKNSMYDDVTFYKITLKNGEKIAINTITSKPIIYTEQDAQYTLSYSTDGKNFTTFKNDEKIILSETMMAEIPVPSSQDGTLTIRMTDPNAPAPVPPTTAKPTNDALWVDGKVVPNVAVYKINGSNYFKIRDLAAVLNGTSKQFSVGYDAASKSVTATTGRAYVPVGGELSGTASGNQTATVSRDTIIINGTAAKGVTVYKIAGNNYFKLRDLGSAIGFNVDYMQGQGMIINTGK